MAKRVTMQQIAEQAGVSKYAVSKALSGQSGVSEETRQRIVKIAMQLGYFLQGTPQQAARSRRSLSQRKSNTIVVLMPNVRFQHRGSPYWGRIIDGITQAIRARGLGMIIITEHSAENLLQVLNPDGLLGIVGVGMIPGPMLLELHQLGIPFILVDHQGSSIPSDSILADNMEAGQRMTEYLIACGHQRLQFVGDLHYSQSFRMRWEGFRVALEEAQIPLAQSPELLRDVGRDRGADVRRIAQWARSRMAEGSLPTALVCANDGVAISVIHGLGQVGLNVPADVSVTGFDDIDEAVQVHPKLTTIRVDKEQMGMRAVDMLLRRFEHPETPREKLLLAGELVFRESVARYGQSSVGRPSGPVAEFLPRADGSSL
ncbi:LacI family DNA-binding transcriptional regulator [Alicyclobacillus kakegawensis]|uniref:LacI family DNA-binding transcriptional regulator n=1 Tax=Alicyclobacillus kakegawensis TaxID=392012 RepID=UPI0009FAB53C|nr:substrate-binding domain-containing protein [Alicyclobacillus kakegawensis]